MITLGTRARPPGVPGAPGVPGRHRATRHRAIRHRAIRHCAIRHSDQDIAFAKAADNLIDAAGLERSHEHIAQLQITIHAADIEKVKPFWLAIVGYSDAADDLISDQTASQPSVRFQQLGAPRDLPPTTRIDIHVPADKADRRIQAALAEGGRIITDEFAPTSWVLTDPEGNQASVRTWRGREGN